MSFSFDPSRGLIVVPAELWGPTGSVGYDPALESEGIQGTTGSGIEFGPRVTVSRIKVLGQDRVDFPVLAHTLPSGVTVGGL